MLVYISFEHKNLIKIKLTLFFKIKFFYKPVNNFIIQKNKFFKTVNSLDSI